MSSKAPPLGTAQREKNRYDEHAKSDSFLSFCACLLLNWAGRLAMAGRVAGTTWSGATDLNRDPDAITPNVDSRSLQSYRGSSHVQTCIRYFSVPNTDKYTASNWQVWCATHYEYSCGGK